MADPELYAIDAISSYFYAASFRLNEPARYSRIRLISLKILAGRRRGIPDSVIEQSN